MECIAKYTNGNTCVSIFSDGTKIREYDGIPIICHPESIDVKITDYCDMGCSYCHESSTVAGYHCDIEKLMSVVSGLQSGVELAIGGGNPLSHPQLVELLRCLGKMGFISNITVNQGHLKRYGALIEKLVAEKLVYGIGISVTNNNIALATPTMGLSNNVVFHLIAGVNTVETIDKIIEHGGEKILVLGYKLFGLGVRHYNKFVNDNIVEWRKKLSGYIGKCTISFDNLAIQQLNVRRWFTSDGWEKFYMGDDFVFTMYIDAVKQEFAPTSRSNDRISFDSCSLSDYFRTHSKKNITVENK